MCAWVIIFLKRVIVSKVFLVGGAQWCAGNIDRGSASLLSEEELKRRNSQLIRAQCEPLPAPICLGIVQGIRIEAVINGAHGDWIPIP